MPTINRPHRRTPRRPHGNNTLIHSEVYNTKQWRYLREEALRRDNYLCQDCLAEGVVKPATEVHHLEEISHGRTAEEMIRLGFCYIDGLVSLCAACHRRRHGKQK